MTDWEPVAPNDEAASNEIDQSIELDNDIEPSNIEDTTGGSWIRPRFSMLSLMLFAGGVCVWSMYFQLLRVNPQIEQQNESMRLLSTELVLTDLERISVARQLQGWYDEAIWMVYIPQGTTYEMHLATREIQSSTPAPKPPSAAQTTLQPGTYKIELQKVKIGDTQRVIVLVDDKETLTVTEPEKSWAPGHGSSGGSAFDKPMQPLHDDDVVVFQRRFMQDAGGGRSRTPDGPTNGIELRLEKTK